MQLGLKEKLTQYLYSKVPVHFSSTPYYEEDDIEEKEKDRNARHRHDLKYCDYWAICFRFFHISWFFLLSVHARPDLKNLICLLVLVVITGTLIIESRSTRTTGFASQIRTRLRYWTIWPVRAVCQYLAALSSIDSKTL